MNSKIGYRLFSTLIGIISLLYAQSTQQLLNWRSNEFIENQGQFDHVKSGNGSPILFGTEGSSTAFYFTKDRFIIQLEERIPNETRKIAKQKGDTAALKSLPKFNVTQQRIELIWHNMNPNVELIAYGEGSLHSYAPSKYGYHLDLNNLKGYSKIVYKNIYPSIDIEVVVHPTEGLKYNVVLLPGGDLQQVQYRYSTSEPVTLDEFGNLIIKTKLGNITEHAPVTRDLHSQKEVYTNFIIHDNGNIGFHIENYEQSKGYVIDPWIQTPGTNNSNKVWEVETDNAGNTYVYGGDSPIRLKKFNAAGTLQWTYNSPWDSANYWIGGFVTDKVTGESYITSGSNGEIRKISTAGASVWNNNPNGFFNTYEYWSLTFNCDKTRLLVGGSRFAFPLTLLGTIMNINLGTGAILNTSVVGFGSMVGIPPNIQEVSSICSAPNNNLYFLTLDTLGSITDNIATMNFKTGTTYNFDYYIPGYGFGTKQPISCIRANASAVYTHNGATIHKRDLSTGAVLATAAIPGGSNTAAFFGTRYNNNGGLDIDDCGNVYVGAVNQLVKFDANLNVVATYPTTFTVYDVSVNSNGEVACGGFAGGTGYTQLINASACAQMAYVCTNCTAMPIDTVLHNNVSCFGASDGAMTVAASNGTPPYTYFWPSLGDNDSIVTGLGPGTYTVIVTDAMGCQDSADYSITEPLVLNVMINSTPLSSCGSNDGTASAVANGGTGTIDYVWAPGGETTANIINLAAGNYTVTVTDDNGCTASATTNINSINGVNANFSFTDITCFGMNDGTAVVTPTSGTSPFTYLWQPTGAIDSLETNLAAGSYTVTVTDFAGCTFSTLFNITEPAELIVNGNVTQPTCAGNDGAITLNMAGGTGATNVVWTPAGLSGTNLTNLSGGTYDAVVTDANGCTDSVSFQLIAPSAMIVNSVLADTTSCSNTCDGNVSINITGAVNYQLAPGNVSATGNFANVCAGTYTVTATDAAGCTITVTVTVGSGPTIDAEFTLAPNLVVLPEATVSFTNQSSGATGYIWDFTNGNTSTDVNPVFDFSQYGIGDYLICVYATGASGCVDSVCHTLQITNDIHWFIPNAFTPNNTELNEFFAPVFSDTSGIEGYHFYIFNRWGQEIFSTGDVLSGWDGTHGQKPAPLGVYVWRIEMQLPNQLKETYIGRVTLLR